MTVGGLWDNREKTFIDDATEAVAIDVNDNQVAVVEAFARWLNARINGGPRTRLLITGGNRRGGKSWIVTALAAALAFAIPDAIIWLVSPTLEKREELERYLKDHIPQAWRTYSARELRFKFPTGASIRNVTGEDAEALKRGEADLVIFNEPQLMGEDVLSYGAPAIIDNGGLVLFAGNPAQKRKGIWFTRLWRAVEAGKYPHGEVHRLDAKDNPDIDKAARRDIGELLALVSPKAHKADEEGIFEELGNHVYAGCFDERRNTCPKFPDIAEICTSTVIRLAGGGTRSVLLGADFQAGRGNVGIELVATGDPRDPTWYLRGLVSCEGDESYFLDDVFERWDQAQALWIGDPSGTWQDAKHTKGRNTFDKFSARNWKILPPREKQTDRGSFPAHPPFADSSNIVNVLLQSGKLIVCMDTAAPVAEAFQRCEYSKTPGKEARPAQSVFSDITDAIRYPIFWATPKPKRKSNLPKPSQIHTATLSHGGPRML